MANEVIHEHHDHAGSDSSGMGFMIGLILLAAVLFLMFYYALPVLRGTTGGTQFNVPGQIDVNLRQTK